MQGVVCTNKDEQLSIGEIITSSELKLLDLGDTNIEQLGRNMGVDGDNDLGVDIDDGDGWHFLGDESILMRR